MDTRALFNQVLVKRYLREIILNVQVFGVIIVSMLLKIMLC